MVRYEQRNEREAKEKGRGEREREREAESPNSCSSSVWLTPMMNEGVTTRGQAVPKGAALDVTPYKRRSRFPQWSHGSKKTKALDDNSAQQ